MRKKTASICNGKICAKITRAGKLTFCNSKGEVLLEEYLRNRKDVYADYCSALDIDAREFQNRTSAGTIICPCGLSPGRTRRSTEWDSISSHIWI